MRLNNLKNVELLRKGLYSHELSQYAGLCNVYKQLIIHSAPNKRQITSQDVQNALNKYSGFLEAASRGDFDYLERHSRQRVVLDGDVRPPDLKGPEIELFKQYSYHSQKLRQFSHASMLLGKVVTTDLKTQQPILSRTALEDFEEFMSQDAEIEHSPYLPKGLKDSYLHHRKTSSLLSLSRNHSPRWLGNQFFNLSKNAENTIASIDPECLPEDLHIDLNLTPAKFGAEITGVKGSVKKFFDKFKHKNKSDEEKDEFSPFTEYEKDYFKKRPSQLHEKVFAATDKVFAKLGSLSNAKKAVVAIGLAALVALAPAIETVSTAHDFNNSINNSQIESVVENIVSQKQGDFAPISVENLTDIIKDFSATSYSSVDDLREDGNAALDAIQATCQTYLNAYKTPTPEEARQIVAALDDATSIFLGKQVELAIGDAYPGYTNIHAEPYYNDTVVDPNNFDKTKQTSGIIVTALNEDGVEISTVLEGIGNPLLGDNLFDKYMSLERGYDNGFNAFYEAISNPNAINPETGKTYTYGEIEQLTTAFLSTVVKQTEQVRGFTNAEIVQAPNGSFTFAAPKTVEPETIETGTTNGTNPHTINDDDGR